MKILLFVSCTAVFGCWASNPVDDPLQRVHQEINKLEKDYDEKIRSLEKNYGEKNRTSGAPTRIWKKLCTTDRKFFVTFVHSQLKKK